MKKLKYILSFAALAVLIFSCDPETAKQDADAINDTDRYPTPTFTLLSSVDISSVNEGSVQEIVWQVTLDKPINRAIDFSWVDLGGTATLHDDYDLENATVPAFGTTGELKVIIYNDDLIEDNETINLTIQSGPSLANTYLVNPSATYPTANIIIDNFESTDFIFSMDWGVTYDGNDGSPHSLCDMDLDLEIYLADFSAIVATSYSSCPESITIPAGALPDGDYWLIPSFWSTASAVPPATDFDIPATVTFGVGGVAFESFDLTGQWNTSGGLQQGLSSAQAYLIKYVLTIAGSSYTVTDSDTGAVIFQG